MQSKAIFPITIHSKHSLKGNLRKTQYKKVFQIIPQPQNHKQFGIGEYLTNKQLNHLNPSHFQMNKKVKRRCSRDFSLRKKDEINISLIGQEENNSKQKLNRTFFNGVFNLKPKSYRIKNSSSKNKTEKSILENYQNLRSTKVIGSQISPRSSMNRKISDFYI